MHICRLIVDDGHYDEGAYDDDDNNNLWCNHWSC